MSVALRPLPPNLNVFFCHRALNRRNPARPQQILRPRLEAVMPTSSLHLPRSRTRITPIGWALIFSALSWGAVYGTWRLIAWAWGLASS